MSIEKISTLYLEQSNHPVWIVDSDLKLIWANDSFIKLIEQKTDKQPEIKTSIFKGIENDNFIDKWTSYYEKVLIDEHFSVIDHFNTQKGSEIELFQISFNSVAQKNPSKTSIVCKAEPITQDFSENFPVHSLLNASLDVYCIIDRNDKFIYVSSASKNQWGYAPKELIGRKYTEFVVEEDMHKTLNVSNTVTKGKNVNSFINRYHKKNGAIAYNLWSAKWDNKNNYMYGVAKNAENLVEKQRLMSISEKRFKALVQEGSDLIAILDADGIYKYVSPTSKTILGIDPKEFIGKSAFEYIHEEDSERVLADLQKIKVQNKVSIKPFRFKNQENEWRWIETVLTNMLDNDDVKGIVANSRDVTTEIKEAKKSSYIEQSLNESSIISRTDKNGVITYVNRNFCDISGYSSEELLGAKHSKVSSNYHKNSFFKRLWKTINSGKIWRGEIKNKSKNGHEYWVFCTIIPYLGERNKPLSFLSVQFNITSRKEAENEKKTFYKTLENSLNEIYTFSPKNLKFYYVNKGARKNLGYTKKEIKSLTPLDLKKEHTETSFNKLVNPLMNGQKKKITFYTNHWRKDGSSYPVEVNLQLVGKGENQKFIAIILDITERKEQKKRLMDANERFEKVTEATRDVIWDWNIKNKSFFRSDNFEKFFGIKDSSSMEHNEFWKEHFHPEDFLKVKQNLEHTLYETKEKRWQSEYRIINDKGNTLFIEDRGLIIRDNKGVAQRMIGAMTDISNQKKLNQELKIANEELKKYTAELERSNEELEQFAFITSHDLQEPLRTVSSYMELLIRKYENQLDEKALKYIAFATDGAKRMQQIILDILEYSRSSRPSDQMEYVDLNNIIEVFIKSRSTHINQTDASIVYEQLPTIKTYRSLITQIFHNLLDNAIKYVRKETKPYVEVKVYESEDYWKFSISDNGIGIKSEFFDKIFTIFQRLHDRDQYGGTGIGLSIVKRSVEFLGGEIWLKSEPDNGTTFNFKIAKIKPNGR